MSAGVLLTPEAAARTAQAVRQVLGSPTDTGAAMKLKDISRGGFWAKIGANDDIGISTGGFSYAWTEQYWTGSAFADMPAGNGGLSGTTDVNYAFDPTETTTTNAEAIATGSYVWLQRAFGSDGSLTWMIVAPTGFTGTGTHVIAINWDSGTQSLTYTNVSVYYRNGLLLGTKLNDAITVLTCS